MPGVRHADRVILLALVLSAPAIVQTFGGALSPAALFIRYVGALLICWAGGAVIERVFDTYSRQARQTEIARQIARLAALRAGTPVDSRPANNASSSADTTTRSATE
jgi:hypothetical protein